MLAKMLVASVTVFSLSIINPIRAEVIVVVGQNTSSECAELDQNIGGKYDLEKIGDKYRISKDNMSWTLTPNSSGRWVGEQNWPHYGGVRIRTRVSLNPMPVPTLSLSTEWGCRWITYKPKPKTEDD